MISQMDPFFQDKIRIGKKPQVVHDTDRWGADTGYLGVYGSPFWVHQEFWKELQEFESFRWKPTVDEALAVAEALLNNEKTPDIKEVREMERLLKRSVHQVWEFNGLLPGEAASGVTEVPEYVRSCAIFGEQTLFPWTWKKELLSRILGIYVRVYNLYSRILGPNRRYRQWLRERYGE